MLYLSISMFSIALLGWDVCRRWIKRVDFSTYQGKQIELLKSETERLEEKIKAAQVVETFNTQAQAELVKKLAEDWARKFSKIEAENAAMTKHIDTQVAGTIAQLPNTGRGFGR